MWVRCCKNTNTTVYCMSVLLIHMSNFYFYIILSFHSRCYVPGVVSRNLQIVNALSTVASFFKWKTQHIKRQVQYLGNINITVWFFVFWCWTFVTQFFIHKFYWICSHYIYFDYKSLIISINKSKKLWFLFQRLFLCWFFLKRYDWIYLCSCFYQLFLCHCSLLHNQI